MFGLGKTTLAWKVFNDPAVMYEFPVRIWLVVSQDFSDKDIFLAILKEFTPINDDIRQLDDMVIARMVATYLDTGSFLIVMDDVWTSTDWDKLRLALPNGNNKGKVLITSRIEDLGTYASNPRFPVKLRFFTEDESWELLRLEALHKLECPSDLESVGRRIAKACDRLPLSVVIIGGILGKYTSSDIYSMWKSWDKVLERVGKYLTSDNDDDKGGRLKKFISLSYDRLPYHLRACFLYLGVFPEDCKIPVSKVIRMWIAEGFIQHDDVLSLEETAEMYLEDLINRNLVTVDRFKANGYKVKTCRVHDTLRDFCRTEAGNGDENFLQEIKFNRKNSISPISDLQKYRHLSIHSNCLDFISSKPSAPRVRSFVCFSKDEYTLSSEDILGAFKLVRVLDIKPLKFTKINRDMYKLVHARYIALSFNLSALPSRFSELWNIQTLIIDTAARTLDVKADIWKLTRLRHFKTNVPATLPEPGKNSKHGAELQTLGLISVTSCTTELLERACNLQKLAISGELSPLLEGQNGSLATMGKMEFLDKLKLVNDVYPRPASEGRLSGLPQPHQFPSKLKSLTLVATFLDWNYMNILGLLQQLEVLKLKQNAFAGSHWKATGDGYFQSLVFLQIEETDLCVWEASSRHFPRLKGLVLKNCDELLDIPIQLAQVPSLQKLELFDCRSAAVSAKRIQEAKEKRQPQAGFAFDLSIFPPTE